MWWFFIFLMAVSPVFGDGIPGVDRVVVYKKKRMLQLCRGDSVLKVYQIALGKEPQGHKTREGDSRTPEGRYVLDWRNPESRYHLSIHISYPSDKDKKRADSLGVEPGGDIMIHGYPEGVSASMWSRYWFLGRDWTDGCIAVSNEAMEEIWGAVENGTVIDIYP